MINYSWCVWDNIDTQVLLFTRPRIPQSNADCITSQENSLRLVTAAYIHPQADTTNWKPHPEAAFIVTGDFNKANLSKSVPKFYQHIDCSTRLGKTLNHCYSPFRNAYKALPSANQITTPFLPRRQKLKQEEPVLRSIQRWSDQSESMLQDCFDHADWEMFRVASENNI